MEHPNSKDLFSVRNIIALSILIVIPWSVYIFQVDADTVLTDQFPLIIEYERFRNGELSFSELWAAKGGHRLPGYKLFFFLNCMFFGFSAKLETILALSVFSIGAAGLSLKFVDKLDVGPLTRWGALAVFVLLFVNGQTLRVTTFSLIAMRLADIMGFAFLAYWAFKLTHGSKDNTAFQILTWTILAGIVILLFGRGWGMAATAGLVCTLLVDLCSRRKSLSFKGVRVHLFIIAVLLVAMIVYLSGINPRHASINKGVELGTLLFYFQGKIGHAYLSLIGTNIARLPLLTIATTIFVVLGTLFATYRTIRKDTRSNTDLMALFFIYFGLFATILVSLMRSNAQPFFQRHNIEIALGAIGLVYFACQFFISAVPRKFRKVGLNAGFTILVLLLVRNLGVNIGVAGILHDVLETQENAQQLAYKQNRVLERKFYREMACNMRAKNCQFALEIIKKRGISKARMQESKE